jgi:hypothetical protein
MHWTTSWKRAQYQPPRVAQFTRREVDVPTCMSAADASKKARWGTSGAEKDR